MSEAKRSGPRKKGRRRKSAARGRGYKWRGPTKWGVGRLSRRRYSCAGDRPWVRIASGEARERVFGEPRGPVSRELDARNSCEHSKSIAVRTRWTDAYCVSEGRAGTCLDVRLPGESALRTVPAEGQPSTPAASPALRYAKRAFHRDWRRSFRVLQGKV